MDIKIAPSLLSADFSNLSSSVKKAEAGGAKYLHFDVMDGHFVPNITFGPMVVRALRPITDAKFLVHLMILGAEKFVDEFARAGSDSISVHPEACTHLHSVLQQIRKAGASPGVAINPATQLSAVELVIDDIDILTIMTVNPGFGGQEFIEAMLPKIEQARRLVDSTGRNIDIAVDGGIDLNTCERVVSAGANVLIAGNSIFNGENGATEAVRRLEACALAAAEGKR
jgi:ribulose-phosphate 3-epimerase